MKKTKQEIETNFRMLSPRGLKNALGLCASILLVISGCLSTGYADENRTVEWIEVHQLDSVIREKNPVIVDLRTPHEFEQGHLAGALNIPVGDLGRNRALLDPYKEKSLLLYCRTVNRAGQALRVIEGRGFKSVYVLRGGYAAFSKSRKPLP